MRLAVVTSHAVQYHSPWFRALARAIDLEVFYCHEQDAQGQAAAGFGVAFEWDVPLLDGYRWTLMKNVSSTPNVFSFAGCDTPEIEDRLKAGRFDACVVTGWYLKSYLQTLRAANRVGVPIVCRGDSQLATRSTWLNVAKYLPYRWLLNKYSGHLYVGQANRDYLQHYSVPERRLFFTPHFVDNAFFREQARCGRVTGRDRAVRLSLGLDDDASVMVWVGKFIEKKRPLDFVEAMARAHRVDPRIRGVMVGDGPLRGQIESAISTASSPVSLAGFKNQSELPEMFAAADALVLTSDARETWGLVVNEAMACGLPVVVSNAAGSSRDLVVDGRTGYRFDVGDVDGLAARIHELTRSLQSHREQITQNVWEKISAYTCAAAVEGTLSAVRTVAHASS